MNLFSFHPGDRTCGFRIERNGVIPKMNASYVKLTHEKTGAVLYYSDRDDGQLIFSVGFRTIPEDDTGVFHILEHSCLDGSESYRLKEPFVNLIKTSMASDLNAMTYPERTIYYFITTNERDYMNMMQVYLDAVFHPLLLSDRRIFEKEAWHLEPDGNGFVNYSGVVFNEMQGHDNNADYVMWQAATGLLFPDRYPARNSGGDPHHIPDLTYENFCETYRRFYGNDNAIFYLSGHLALEEELSYIDRVLSSRPSFGYVKPPVVAPQPPTIGQGTVYYQLSEKEEEAGNTHLMLTYVLPQERCDELSLAFNLLSNYMAETNESPLSSAVLNADVGLDFDMGCDIDCLQPLVFFTLGKSDPDKAESFENIVTKTLRELTTQGLNKERMVALLDRHETDCRRAALRVDSGFALMTAFIREHVMTGDVTTRDSLAMIREALSNDPLYFEHLVETYILNSHHHALISCVPSRTLEEERRAAMKARLDIEMTKLNARPDGYKQMSDRVEALNAYLVAEDDPEAMAAIPHLSSKDLTHLRKYRDISVLNTPMKDGHVTSLYYETRAEGMVLAGWLFDLSSMPVEDLKFVRCLKDALMDLPAAGYTVSELSDLWTKLQTNVDWNFLQAVKDTSASGSRQYLQVRLDAPEEHLKEATELLGKVVTHLIFDKTILSRIFSNTSNFKNHLIMRGNSTAVQLAEASLSAAGAIRWELTGVPAYNYLSKLADNFDCHTDELIAGLSRVSRAIFGGIRPLCYCIGSRDAYEIWTSALVNLPLSVDEHRDTAPVSTLQRIHKALSIPGNVNYCCESFALSDADAVYSPKMQVITSHLYSTYFWDEIRARGGAYGASAVAFPYGLVSFVSYRDPRVGDTYDVYQRLPDWLDEHIPEADELDSLIVSTIGSGYCTPQSPLDEGIAALTRYLKGKTSEDIACDIQTILSTQPQDFAHFSTLLRSLNGQKLSLRTAVGSKETLATSGLFEEVEEL
ncbi:MAG: hypothetical protein E7645_04630 [Ruminococcaceae bacterium]|nr:hypothetical protein [Oscillospiraceae bacterium]